MILERIKKIAERKNLSLSQLEKEMGLKTNYLYRLKNQIPKSDKLILIADYLDVSIDYLLGRDEFISKQNNTFITKDIQGGRDVTINNNSPQEKTINNIDNSVDLQRDSITLLETDEAIQAKILMLLEKQTKLLEDMLFEIKKS